MPNKTNNRILHSYELLITRTLVFLFSFPPRQNALCTFSYNAFETRSTSSAWTSSIVLELRVNRTQSQGFDSLSALPGFATLKFQPSANGARFDANHLLPAVCGAEVRHAFGLFLPRVPDDDVIETVTLYLEDLLGTLLDGN